MLGVCENSGREAGRADSLFEKERVEVKALFYEVDGVLERGFGEVSKGKKGDDSAGAGFAQCEYGRGNAEKEVFEVGKVRGVWRQGGAKRWKCASAVDEVDSILRAEWNGVLVGVVGILVREGAVIGAFLGGCWKRRKRGGQIFTA